MDRQFWKMRVNYLRIFHRKFYFHEKSAFRTMVKILYPTKTSEWSKNRIAGIRFHILSLRE